MRREAEGLRASALHGSRGSRGAKYSEGNMAAGGIGGIGGIGGSGGGGAGGSSYAIYRGGNAQITTSSSTLTHGTAGQSPSNGATGSAADMSP